MAIVLMLIAALFIAGLICFCVKVSMEEAPLSLSHGTVFYCLSRDDLLNPCATGKYEWSSCMAGFGLTGGIFAAGLMAFIGKSLEQGPPGLTFAAVNSATVMPTMCHGPPLRGGVRLCIYFVERSGLILVVVHSFGLDGDCLHRKKNKWVMFAIAAFLMHLAFLCFLQWRALFVNFPEKMAFSSRLTLMMLVNQWFMPMVFVSDLHSNSDLCLLRKTASQEGGSPIWHPRRHR